MKLTTTVPTETGWYWFCSSWFQYGTSSYYYNKPAVVYVKMDYKIRNNVVPHIIGTGWHGPLRAAHNPQLWSTKLDYPEVPTGPVKKESTP